MKITLKPFYSSALSDYLAILIEKRQLGNGSIIIAEGGVKTRYFFEERLSTGMLQVQPVLKKGIFNN